MAATADYLTQLQKDKQTLVGNLVAKGVEAASDETFTTLVPKVADIQSGGGEFEITSAYYLFYGNNRIDAVNELCSLISSNCTNFASMFVSTNIEEIPKFRTSNGTDFNNMFNGNRAIKTIPELDTSNGTNFSYMFANCNGLEEVPKLDTSNGTNFASMFTFCTRLKAIPELDTSNGTNFSGMFQNSGSLEEAPKLDTSNGTNFSYMFGGCNYLTTIQQLDMGKAVNVGNVVNYCANLVNFGGFKDLGKAYDTNRSENYSNYKLDLSTCTSLTHDSLMNVINNLYDIASAGVKSQQLVLGSTNLAKLTEEEIAIATNKGWTVS